MAERIPVARWRGVHLTPWWRMSYAVLYPAGGGGGGTRLTPWRRRHSRSEGVRGTPLGGGDDDCVAHLLTAAAAAATQQTYVVGGEGYSNPRRHLLYDGREQEISYHI